MTSLKGKKIIVGVSGSIAAYKSAYLVRQLIKEGCEVKIIMTQAATEFITPLTLSTLSKNPVHLHFFDNDTWANHVELGLWADVLLIAPATATTLSKCANGQSDNMLLATYLSAKCPVIFAPAMDLDMWHHPSTQDNIKKLTAYGNSFIAVGHGELASGLYGDGRMAEPEEIVDYLREKIGVKQDLSGKKVLVTAGPTYEAIDPVRFIGNHSSGKMGLSLAEECERRGGIVTLILGPNHLNLKNFNGTVSNVTSAQEMRNAAFSIHESADIVIFAAAVADYKPVEISKEKIKKTDSSLQLTLTKTNDIAAELGKQKSSSQIHVGFALETHDEEQNALKKVHTKHFDFIVLNSLNDEGAGFKHDTNKIRILDANGLSTNFPLKHKSEVAKDIIDHLCRLL